MADPRDDRPQPAYGEYAPEGWEWKPEDDEASTTDAAPVDELRGVPHNLGVSGAGTNRPASVGTTTASAAPSAPAQDAPRSSQAGDPPPYRATENGGTERPAAPLAPAGTGAAGTQTKPRRPADVAITIVLLVLGAFGALYCAMMLFSLPATLSMVADAFGIADFSPPSWLDTFSTVTALGMFALYAVVLIFSIQRMRAGKLTFWVPLSAGVLAGILTFVFLTIAMMSSPELVHAANDPDAFQKMLDYMNTMQ